MGNSCGVHNKKVLVADTSQANLPGTNKSAPGGNIIMKKCSHLYVFGFMDMKEEKSVSSMMMSKQSTIIRFDAENEEWESIMVGQNAQFFEFSQACMVDDDMILLTGGRQSTENSKAEMGEMEEASSLCQLYSIPKNQFFSFPPMNLGRFCHMMVYFKDHLYVMGGKTADNDTDGITSSVEKIAMNEIKEYIRGGGGVSDILQTNAKKNEGMSSPLVKARWSEIEPFNKYRYNALTIVFKKEIFLFGGITRGGKLCRFVEKFNIAENHWYTLKWKMPFAIHSASITFLNSSEIIVIGGKNDNGLTPSIYQMNFASRRYLSKGAFSFRLLPKVLNHQGNIYIFGGDKNMSCEKLNPVDFVSFEASESYNTLLNGDLTNFPAGHPTVVLNYEGSVDDGDSLNPFKEPFKSMNLEVDLEKFYLFGTPNHPFMLELNTVKETATFHPVSFDLRFFFFGCSVRVNENFLISMGGITPPRKKASRSVQIIACNANFDAKKAAKMKEGRCKFSAICCFDKVFVVGGINFENENENYLASCEMYDINKNTWNKIASMKQNRYNCALGVSGEKIYAFGGSNGQNYLETIECYSITQDDWYLFKIEELKLEEPSSNITILHLSDHEFLMIGGSTTDKALKDVAVFETKTNTQQKVGQLTDPRSSSKVFKNNDHIFILGGSKTDQGLEIIKKDNYEHKPDLFKMFDDALTKCYKDKMLNGIEGA